MKKMTITTYPTIYKKTSTGATQIWYQEISEDGSSFRTVSGQIDGKKVTSGWSLCEPKNVGKANATTVQEQCILEVQANYKKKLAQGNYKETLDEETFHKDNFFKPMLAKIYGEDYTYNSSDNLYSQPKLDGLRCIATKNGLFSRLGKPIISAPHILEALGPIFEKYPDVILDGELYADKLADNFNEIISLARQSKPTEEDFAKSKATLQYWVYDQYSPNDFYLRNLAVSGMISILLPKDQPYIVYVPTAFINSEEHMDELYAQYMSQGYEGQMVRVSNKGYENKRSKQLLKRKEFKDEEFKIVNIVEGLGNWAGYAKSVVFELNDGSGRTSDAGIAGTQEFTKKLLKDKKKYVGTLVTVKYQNMTPEGKPRFPIATKFLGTKKREM